MSARLVFLDVSMSFLLYSMLCVCCYLSIGIAEVYPVWSYMYARTHVGDITPPPPYQQLLKIYKNHKWIRNLI